MIVPEKLYNLKTKQTGKTSMGTGKDAYSKICFHFKTVSVCGAILREAEVSSLSGFLYGSHFIRKFKAPFFYLNISKSVHVWRALETITWALRTKLKWSGFAASVFSSWASSLFSNLFLQTEPLPEPGPCCFSWTGWPESSQDSLTPYSRAGVTDTHQLLCGHWESQLGSSRL